MDRKVLAIAFLFLPIFVFGQTELAKPQADLTRKMIQKNNVQWDCEQGLNRLMLPNAPFQQSEYDFVDPNMRAKPSAEQVIETGALGAFVRRYTLLGANSNRQLKDESFLAQSRNKLADEYVEVLCTCKRFPPALLQATKALEDIQKFLKEQGNKKKIGCELATS